MIELIANQLDIFARSGGGGSSSGGGDAISVIGLIGYVPSYYLGKIIKKIFPRKLELIISATFASVVSIGIFVIGVMGGFTLAYISIAIIAGIWIGWASAFFSVWDKLKKKNDVAKQSLQVAASSDSAWDEPKLLDLARTVFMQYQQDWSTSNLQSLASYTTSSYYAHASLMLRAMSELGRKNVMSNVQIMQFMLVEVHDEKDNSLDTFTVAVEAKADDQLIETASGTQLYSTSTLFTEYWTFARDDITWLLSRIDQSTAVQSLANTSLQQLANQNNMFYSLDMGWLYMPKNGVLFKNGKFGISDINNHVIGTYNDRLVQLYSYLELASNKTAYKVVAQVNLPKSYGGIIIQPKKSLMARGLFARAPKGYKKYTFEWPDFNNRYDVYATDADRLATFELLNPGFMAYLFDTDAKATIEVADTTVYLYKDTMLVSEQDYQTFLTILMKAFKELQL